MAIAQPMSTVQYVAMLSSLEITGVREQELSKYLQQNIGKRFSPTQRGVLVLSKGCTKVYTGNIPWTYEGKEQEENVEWMEKDLHSEIEMQLARMLKSGNARPSNVKAVQAIVGGITATQHSNLELPSLPS